MLSQSCASACSSWQTDRNASFIVGAPCQTELKRTLRSRAASANSASRGDIHRRSSLHSARMVNARFPIRVRYGFESVDARISVLPHLVGGSIENLRRIQSFEFSANFPTTAPTANTGDLTAAVMRKADCESQSQRGERDDGDARCFSCFEWHSGSGLCSCCCRETPHRNPTNCRRSARATQFRRRPLPSPI